ncbi:LacI family DNA-binding transcriptional regulator [Actinoplanes sp. RD1]|uniref:LacI family DNA-binding transcriptional regulator n=1 Tax=Actinoplanes sp. RD1 TaxID=3064538 RepID=UPI002740BD0E|nr:LacI family DNA-binding transcriptional regulator [Actinoplanes sp. RD1]
MTVTIRDVARLAGVSPSSVCRALANPGAVRPGTREQVERAVRDLGYVPNRAARALSTGRTGNLGVILPDLANPFFAGIVKAAQTRARTLGHSVFLSDIDEDPAVETLLIQALVKQVDGLLLCSPRSSDEELRALRGQVPTVLLNRRLAPFPSVTLDAAGGMAQALVHLHALGHQRVAYVAGPHTSWANRERLRGLRQAAEPRPIELIEVGTAPPTVEGGAAVADVVLTTGVTAVLAFNDLTALGLLNRLRARNIHVPEDISVIGFDGILLSSLVSPALTTIGVDMDKLGQAGVDVLVETMADPARTPVHRKLPTQLIVRASTDVARPH